MSDTPAPGRGTDSPGTLENTMNEQQKEATGEQQLANENELHDAAVDAGIFDNVDTAHFAGAQPQEPARDQPVSPPDAVVEIRFDAATNNMQVQFAYGQNRDPSHPGVHFALWLQRNLDVISAMAAREFNALREMGQALEAQFTALPVLEQPPQDKPAVVESATPRLIGPNGTPLN